MKRAGNGLFQRRHSGQEEDHKDSSGLVFLGQMKV